MNINVICLICLLTLASADEDLPHSETISESERTHLNSYLNSTENLEKFVCTHTLGNHFHHIGCNLLKITFSKTITNAKEFYSNLIDGKIDVVKLKVTTQKNGESNTNLPLGEAFEMLLTHNEKAQIAKAVMLKFDNDEEFKGSIDVIDKYYPKFKNLILLNADIIAGPGKKTSSVDSQLFLTNAKRFPASTLCIGWSTGQMSQKYLPQHLQAMLEATHNADLQQQPVTFSVRADTVARSSEGIVWLMNVFPKATLSVWLPSSVKVDKKKFVDVVELIGRYRVYLSMSTDDKLSLGLKELLMSQ